MSDLFDNQFVTLALIMAVALAVSFILSCINTQEGFEDAKQNSQSLEDDAEKLNEGEDIDMEMPEGPLDGMDPINEFDGAQVEDLMGTEVEPSAFPSAQLSSEALLPSDRSSTWTDAHPEASAPLNERNFLTTTGPTNFGINTQGSSLRNANQQIRSEPPNARNFASVWNLPTITPDSNRRPLEIGGDF